MLATCNLIRLNTLPDIFDWCLTEQHELLQCNPIPSKQIMGAEHVLREKKNFLLSAASLLSKKPG